MRTPTLLELAVVFAALSLAFGALERLRPDVAAFRPPGSRLTDGLYWTLNPFITKTAEHAGFVVALLIMLKAAGLPLDKAHAQAFLNSRGAWAANLPVPLQALLTFAAADFFAYWQHRLFHGRRLWKFHAVHHGSTALDWLSAVRVHPVNEIAARLFQFIPLILLGFPVAAVAAYVPFLTLYGIFLHANVPWDFGPLRCVLASPRFHRWHHTSQEEGRDKNFAGLFPLWDLLFGTYHLPRDRKPERFGTVGEPVPEGFLAQLAYPFR